MAAEALGTSSLLVSTTHLQDEFFVQEPPDKVGADVVGGVHHSGGIVEVAPVPGPWSKPVCILSIQYHVCAFLDPKYLRGPLMGRLN